MISSKFSVRWEYSMRRFLLLAVAMSGTVSCAQAADLPDYLRGSLTSGSAPTINWRGFYVGGQAGYGSSDESFNGSTTTLLNALI
jgi:opacity protein-like surface antigen